MIVFPTMSWSIKKKAFCVEAYFASNSYKVAVQASFRRKFQHRHAPSKSRIFDCIQEFRKYEITGPCKILIQKVGRILILVGCVRVLDNFARRMRVCLQQRGGHLEHILEIT